MGEPKRYGLIIPAKKNTKKPMIKKPAVFGDDSSDDEERAHREVNLSLIQESQKKKQMKQTQIEIQKALKEDPTVYEYDAVYDKMEEKKKAASVKVPEKDKKPKYIGSLLKAAAARKREFERTVERQVQKEREQEKGEFDDKEAFVTEAFRQKMQEQLEEEERIKCQDAIDAANDVTKQKDLSLFYRNLLNKNVSLGGSFTANHTTKTDLPNIENDKESQEKDKRVPPVMSENRKPEKHRDRKESKYSREQGLEENPTHSRVPSQHMRNHDHNCKQRDSESYKDQRSTDLSNWEQRRGSDREHEKFATHRHSSGFKPHQSGRDERQNNDGSKYSWDNLKAPDKNKIKSKEITKESKETLKEESLNKFAKRSTGETVSSAKERYLARKQARNSAKSATANDDSD
ncbi:nuclear speckle splicing regulatory protein 1-like [Stylophora pistillata]|uniref:Nuclear speckle splicing regulatory protein 1 n=1 Tax=Stylophora pistillata TaxID=50429 RepID=A0A2B4RXG3_STYPI|nr:nuclear speckle splicing regulatory protein 1-like [Stylophora pistillata]PFX20945.1 Nuclear speckle splicing regulatory protein 1 [Stylophora pistillata]